MIELIREAHVGLWVSLYISLYLIWFGVLKGIADKKMKEQDVSPKGAGLVASSVILSTLMIPTMFLVVIYKLIGVGVHHEVSFVVLLTAYVLLSVVNKLIQTTTNKLISPDSPHFPLVFLAVLIRLPFLMFKGIVVWMTFAKVASLWVESTFWTMIVAFILNISYNNVVNLVTGKNKKNEEDKEKASEE